MRIPVDGLLQLMGADTWLFVRRPKGKRRLLKSFGASSLKADMITRLEKVLTS